MANLWDIIIDAANETETGTPSSSTAPTITEYVRWCNKGQDIITNYTKCLEKIVAFPSVAKQTKYTMPSEFIRPQYAEWFDGSSRHRLDYYDIIAMRGLTSYNFGTGTPCMMTYYDNKMEILPPTSGSAASTTLNGSHTATVTTITVASTTGFASRGMARLYTSATVYEDVEYTGTTSTTLTGVTRGVGGTTAVAYSGGETVKELDLQFHSVVRYITRPYNIYTTGTATFTGSSATVSAGSTAPYWSGNVYAGWQIGQGTNPTKWYDISAVSSNLTISSAYAEATSSNSSYVISPTVDLRSENHDLLTKYLIYRTWKRREQTPEAVAAYNDFMSAMNDARGASIDRSDSSYPHWLDTDIANW